MNDSNLFEFLIPPFMYFPRIQIILILGSGEAIKIVFALKLLKHLFK